MDGSPIRSTKPDTVVAYDLANSIGFCLEFLFYGGYCVLFPISLLLVCRQKRHLRSSGMVFLASNILLFLSATIYTGINVWRFIVAFVIRPGDSSSELFAIRWDNTISWIAAFFVLHIADFLAIFRAFVVWERNIYVVTIPSILLLTSTTLNMIMLASSGHPNSRPYTLTPQFLTAIYHVHLYQNVITTGLIIFRIWKQHRASVAAGLQGTGFSLLKTIRIIVESAAIYTAHLFTLVILDIHQNPYVNTMATIQIPLAGIVFNLLAIRVYLSQTIEVEIRLSDFLPNLSADS